MRLLIAAAVFTAAMTGQASAAVFVVNSTLDTPDASAGDGVCATSGAVCTLRAAIQETNALAGADTINFSIGSGVQTIVVGATLPAITSPVVINGQTQPGYAGSPLIVLDGGTGAGLTISAGNSTVKGLVIIDFSGDGMSITGGNGNVVENTYVGMAADGSTDRGNAGHGIVIQSSSNNRIGGPSAAQRNLISGNDAKGNGGGIVLNNSNGNTIQGNFIGTDITGMVEHPNEARGIAVIGSNNNLIGGPGAGAGNLIAGNRATGVRMLSGSSNNVVQRNIIGLNSALNGVIPNDRGVQLRDGDSNQVIGNAIVGNTYDGVLIWGATNSRVEGNIIAYNGYGPIGDVMEAGYFGIWVATGTNNRLTGNRIIGNYHLGINLGTDAGTANDSGDADSGANNLQNYPVLSSARTTGLITGSLNSVANKTYRIEFFSSKACDSPGQGEGENYLGFTSVATNGSGNASFSVSLGMALPSGWVATATAIDPDGNTSEFSACRVIN